MATCRLDQRLGDIDAPDDLCVVLNAERIVLGELRGKALKGDPNTPVEQAMNPAPSTHRPNTSVHEMAHELLESGGKRVLVTDADGRLVGWISRAEVEQALDEHRRHNDGPVLASPR